MRKAVIGILILLGSGVVWLHTRQMQGRVAAAVDLAFGRHRQLGAGLPPGNIDLYTRVLRDRYGIEYVPVAGCVVDRSLADYMTGYNQVSDAAARRKFGRDVTWEAWGIVSEMETRGSRQEVDQLVRKRLAADRANRLDTQPVPDRQRLP